MKNALFGTTALVAAGAIAGEAMAGGVELGLSGEYSAAAGANVAEDFYPGLDDPRWGAFRQDVEIYVFGKTRFDNGISVGAKIEIDGQIWAFFEGRFGEVRFGNDDDAVEKLAYGIPTATNIFGVDSPDFSFSNAWASGLGIGTNTTNRQLSGDATKILYFSPTFGGFTFGMSFAPDRYGSDCYFGFTSGTSCGSSAPGGTTYANNFGQISEVISAAINFEHDFDDFYLVTGAGGAHGELERPGPGNPSRGTNVWTARGHLHVGIGNWYMGGAIAYTENQYGAGNGTPNGGNVLTYGLGITYNWDAWTVGLAWSGGRYDEFYGGAGGDGTLNVFRFEGRYDIDPDISLEASAGYDNWNVEGGVEYDAWTVMSGFHIGF